MKQRLLLQATRQIRETGTVDCMLYMDLQNAGINPEALIERIKDGE
ncbi:hypothetical protein [Geobacter sp. SVR]|nr:hypothetical protein [Geobacter sp. SVR]BCS53329.1 hypothetical protein GSVR_16370 [Geobacter sp. SVR]GCF85545.1 hypothetical protein GSbR_21450 [Geobacter sp. SVR]